MTIQEYKESQKRAEKMVQLFQVNPEMARKNAAKSFDLVVEKIKQYKSKQP
jgi:hypothetical protein